MKKEKLLTLLGAMHHDCVKNNWDNETEEEYQQIVALIKDVNLPEFLRGIASKQWEVDGLKKHIKNLEERCAELIGKKPKVTGEWIQEKTMEMIEIISKGKILEAMSFIRKLVGELTNG